MLQPRQGGGILWQETTRIEVRQQRRGGFGVGQGGGNLGTGVEQGATPGTHLVGQRAGRHLHATGQSGRFCGQSGQPLQVCQGGVKVEFEPVPLGRQR